MSIASFDHVAIPIERVDEMLGFYEALEFTVHRSPPFYSVHFGDNKINFHGPEAWHNHRFTLRGPAAVPGCGDFCFVWSGARASLSELLDRASIAVIEGPVTRSGELRASPHLAYGTKGIPDLIPANAVLVLEIWLRSVVNG